MTDMLDEIFELQRGLNEKIGVHTEALRGDPEGQGRWILNYCCALSQETAELVDCVPWKWWAKYQKFDQQNARVEIIDLFHEVFALLGPHLVTAGLLAEP